MEVILIFIYLTFHGVGFACTSLAIGKNCTIEAHEHRVNEGSESLVIQLQLLGTIKWNRKVSPTGKNMQYGRLKQAQQK